MKVFLAIVLVVVLVVVFVQYQVGQREQECRDRGGTVHWLYGFSHLCVSPDGKILD